MKKVKRLSTVVLMLTCIIGVCFGYSQKVQAAPAPGLTSLQITDLALDDNDEIHVEITEIGTSRPGTRFVWWNGSLCQENIYETQTLWGRDNIAYGYKRYYHTGVYYSSSLSGRTFDVRAQSTNLMSPWNNLSTSTSFTFN